MTLCKEVNFSAYKKSQSKKRIRAALLAFLAICFVILLMQMAQSVQQDAAIGELSARLSVVEHRTNMMWRRLGLAGDPISFASLEMNS